MDVSEDQQGPLCKRRKTMKQSMHILMLNEYCLLEIFEYLQIEEVFRMEKVCTRFREISQRIYKSTRTLDIDKLYDSNVSITDIMWITSRVGQYVHTLYAEEYKITVEKGKIPIFSQNNAKVSSIEHEGDEDFSFRSLKQAYFIFCEISDEEMGYLLPLEQIEILEVSFPSGTEGIFLKSLKNIVKLIVNGIDHINSEAFKEFCEANPNLPNLDLVHTHICSNDLHAIATNLKSLKNLRLSDYYKAEQDDFRGIAELPKLQHLDLCQYTNDIELEDYERYGNIIDLSEILLLVSYHNQLETLYYSNYQLDTESTTISKINRALAKMTNLRSLFIIFKYCKLFGANNVLQELTVKHKLETLYIESPEISTHELEMFIKRCPTIELICITCYKLLDMSFLDNIRDCLSQRSHVLELRFPKKHEAAYIDLINEREFTNFKLVFK